ncbi:hypothetical protein [Carnimonas bestiolae]|uniref:hypothetical protein n=1 Tax=Carnimonas bestiolae TaxID=3402172 RepID=UPI003EDBEFCF
MGQLIKSKFGKFLGIDSVSGKLKLCGPSDFSEWVFLKEGVILTNDGQIIESVGGDLVVATDSMPNKESGSLFIQVLNKGIAFSIGDKYLSDHQGQWLKLINTRGGWGVFRPQ